MSKHALDGFSSATAEALATKRRKVSGEGREEGKDGRPRLALVCSPLNDSNLRLARQVSCSEVVYYDMSTMPLTTEALSKAKSMVGAHGLRLSVVEGGPPMGAIIHGGPKQLRQQQMETFNKAVRAMGEAGVNVLCYNFMPHPCRVGRSSYEEPVRGGALSSRFSLQDFDDSHVPSFAAQLKLEGLLELEEGEEVEMNHPSAESMWANFKWFVERAVPVAQEAGVYLALHPDDPPLQRLRGTNRIFNTVEGFRRLVDMAPSPHNGVTFDVSLFSLMGGADGAANVPSLIEEFKDRIHFIHFRDVVGTADNYTEHFHDQGDTDHPAVMKAIEQGHDTGYKSVGYFSGKASGYTMQGRLFACGYLRGLMQATEAALRAERPELGRVVVVTGGANGIGRAVCEAFAKKGATVYCGDIDAKRGAELVARYPGGGSAWEGQVRFVRCDAASEFDNRALVRAAIGGEGRLDVLVNNVGIQSDDGTAAHALPTAVFDRVMAVNVRSYFVCAAEAAKHWLATEPPRGGVIVNLSSVQGLQSQAGIPAYAASKGAILSLNRQLAVQYGKQGIRSNAVCPGTIATPLVQKILKETGCSLEAAGRAYPIGRVGQPSEVANAVLFLASDLASNVTGEALTVDGGIMALGGWASAMV